MSVNIENFETIFGIKNNIQVLRSKVLELAIQGKLVEQDPNDEPASELVKKIQAEREKLVKEGKIKKQKVLEPIDEAEISFDVPKNWTWVKLGAIAENIRGVTFSKNDATKDILLNYDLILRGGNIHPKTEKLLFGDNLYIPKGIAKFEQYLQKGDTILVASSGTKSSIAKSAFITETLKDTSVGAFLLVIRPIKVEPLFLRYLMKFFRQRIIDDTSGTNISNVGKEQLDNFLIPLPPQAEQYRIVSKMEYLMFKIDKLEESLEKRERLMELLPKAVVEAISSCQTGEELKEQLQLVIENFEVVFQTSKSMQELRNVVLQLAIEGKLVPQDTDDEPTSELVKAIQVEKDKLVKEGKIKKQKPLELIEEGEIPFEIPESWKWVRLGTIISFQGGYAYKSNSYIENSNYQIIRLGNVKNDRILIDANPVYIPNNIALETMNYKISEGDILVTMTGTRNKRDYFYTCRVCEDDLCSKELFLNQRVGNLKSYKAINSYYINLMLKAESILDSIFTTETGTANQGNIGSGSIENIIVPLPPINEQHRIVQKVKSIMSLIDQMEVELKRKVDLVEKMASM